MNGRGLLAFNLRRNRIEKGASPERLAFDAGVDRAYQGGIEPESRNPTVDLLDRIAATLEVSVAELFKPGDRPSQKLVRLRRGRRRLANREM
jgi:transcriptional regulator with XRE-family HTH domain